MGKYLDIIRQSEDPICVYDQYDQNDLSPPSVVSVVLVVPAKRLEARCPDHIPRDRWQRAVEDARRFLATWGAQAVALGWTEHDVFGLPEAPERPHVTLDRLARRDALGLIWLLRGNSVVALTAASATIRGGARQLADFLPAGGEAMSFGGRINPGEFVVIRTCCVIETSRFRTVCLVDGEVLSTETPSAMVN